MSYGNSAMVISTTINQHIKGAIKGIVRNNFLLTKLESAGCIRTGMHGRRHEWRLRHKRSPMRTLGDGGTIIFGRENKHVVASLEYRAYVVSGSITEQDKEMNKGESQIVKLWADAVNERIDDIRFGFHEKIWQADGYASGSRDIMGMPSCMGATANASSIFGTNADTYAGRSTVRGAHGGTFNGSPFWPFGQSDPQYDFHSPIIVDYTSALAAESGGWETDVPTWTNTGAQALRTGILCAQRVGENLDCIHMGFNLYRQFKDSFASDTRLIVQPNTDPKMTHLGMQTITYDGVEIRWENGIPSELAYGLNYKNIELLSLYKQLFKSDSDFDLASSSDRVAIKFLGNLKFKKLNGMVQWRNLT